MAIILCKKLLELTRTILAAVKAGEHTSLGKLLGERKEIIESIKKAAIPDLEVLKPIFHEINALEAECMEAAIQEREKVLAEMKNLQERKRASSGYTTQYLKYMDDIH